MTETVVAAVDCSPRAVPVLQWADRQAALTGATLVAVTAWGSGLPAAAQGREPDVPHAAQQALADSVAAALPPERAAAARTVAVPQETVDALTTQPEAELVVVGAHHTHAVLPLGSVTARVIGRAPCPVAIVRSADRLPTDRIAVGLDGSPASQRALEWAVQQARRTGAEILAVTAWQWVPEYTVPPYGRQTALVERESAQQLDKQLAELGEADLLRVRRRLVQGTPADVLLQVAADTDLLVVGNHGAGAAVSRLLGSVSQRVARRAEVPVVVVHDR